MVTLRWDRLNGVGAEYRDDIYEAMETCTNRERLVVSLFLMSELPESEMSLPAIEENLRLIFPPATKNGYLPDDYEDFQASTIRFQFNKETSDVKAGRMPEEARLWKNLKKGYWRNTAAGNECALEVLRECGLRVTLHGSEEPSIREPVTSIEQGSQEENVTENEQPPTRNEDHAEGTELEPQSQRPTAVFSTILALLMNADSRVFSETQGPAFTYKGTPEDVRNLLHLIAESSEVDRLSLTIAGDRDGWHVELTVN